MPCVFLILRLVYILYSVLCPFCGKKHIIIVVYIVASAHAFCEHQGGRKQRNISGDQISKKIIELPERQINDPLVGEKLFSSIPPSNTLVSLLDP